MMDDHTDVRFKVLFLSLGSQDSHKLSITLQANLNCNRHPGFQDLSTMSLPVEFTVEILFKKHVASTVQ